MRRDSGNARHTDNNPELSDVTPQEEHDTARRAKGGAKPTRLADRQEANAGTIAALRSRREGIEGTLAAEAKAIADTAIEKLKKDADEKLKRLEAAKAATASAVRDIEANPPAKGLFGFGYGARKAEWDRLLASAKSDDAWAGKDLEGHGKNLDAAISKAVESSKGAAKDKNTEAVREIAAIDAEIDRLNGDVNGIFRAAKSLLWHSEYHRFRNVQFPEKDCAHRGEILGVAEYGGHAVVLQDGPTEHSESESKDMYGRPLTTVNHVIWAHEVSPERAPEMEALAGNVATITTGDDGEIDLTDVLTKNQEHERSHRRGFSR